MIEKIGANLIRIGAMTSIQVEEVLQRQRAGDNRLFQDFIKWWDKVNKWQNDIAASPAGG